MPDNGASAGGGGSGFVAASDGTLTAGVQEGDGSVAIGDEPTSDTCASPVTPAAPVAAGPLFTG